MSACAPAPPVEDPVGEAFGLLQLLNTSRTAAGTPLPEVVVNEGFQPWWFLQESLLWDLLVPYAENRWLVRSLLAGRETAGPLPPAVRELLSRLEVRLPASAAGSRAAGGASAPRALRLASRLGLLGVSLASAIWFRLRGRDTLVYILDQVSPGLRHDFRLHDIYGELRRRGYRFAELVHLRGAREAYAGAWKNLFRRRRPVAFLEALVRLGRDHRSPGGVAARPLDWQGDEVDRPLIELSAGWALRRARLLGAEIAPLRRLLRRQAVRRVVALDDPRHVNGLTAACRLEGIPILGYMHGLFNRYHPALMCFGLRAQRRHAFDLVGLWSEYFRRRLLEGDLYQEDETFVCGPIRSPAIAGAAAAARRPAPPWRVLLVSEPRARQREVRRYVDRLLADRRFRLVLKVRPGERAPHFSLADGENDEDLEIAPEGTVYEAFERCDVVVGTYSSVLYEAALVPLPAVVLRTSFSYGHQLAEDGLAEFAESPGTVCDVVARAASLPAEELSRRRAELWGEPPAEGAARLFDVAEAELWPAR